MGTFSEVLSNVRRYCDNLTEADLSTALVRQVAWDQQRLMTNEQVLSDENWFLAVCNLGTPNTKDLAITAPNFSLLVSVERKDPMVGDEDFWYDVRIVNRNSLPQEWRLQHKVAAQFGTPPRMGLSWNPAWYGDILRYWYETTISDNVFDQDPTVFSQCITLLTFLTAKGCRELKGLPRMTFLDDSIALGWAQFEKFARRSPEERPFYKQRAYGIRRAGLAWRRGGNW